MGVPVRYRFASLLVLLLAACDGPAMPTDGGGLDATTADAGGDAGPVCTSSSDCDDGLYCNGTETCSPGASGAAPNGCVAGTSPCATGETCDETSTSCIPSDCPSDPSMRDMDGDGHQTMACPGGDDCDDTDPNRFPGNTELCPGGGDPLDTHDEDCDSSTVGDLDADSDTYVSAVCCNGDTCGPDCDDSNASIHPGVAETCDGMDDDCSGVEDDAPNLCPGGACLAGHCDFMAWDRGFGSSSSDGTSAVAIDSAGNIYVAGVIAGTVDFGAGPVSIVGGSRAVFVAKLQADGTLVWSYVSPGGSYVDMNALDMAVSPSGDRVYVVGDASALDFGSGTTTGAFFVRLDASGSYLGDQRFGAYGTTLGGVAADASGAVFVGGFTGTVDWGGGSQTAQGGGSMILAAYDPDGVYRWAQVFHASGSNSGRKVTGSAIALDSDSTITVGGSYKSGTVSFGSALAMADLYGSGFTARLSSTGSPVWGEAIQGSAGFVTVESVAVRDGQAYAVGRYDGMLDPGTGAPAFSASDISGFVVGYQTDGTPAWARSYAGGLGGQDEANATTTDTAGHVFVVGSFGTPTTFGGSTRSPVGRDGFLARYTLDGVYQTDFRYASSGSAGAGSVGVRDVAVGPGNSTVIVGEFTGTVNFGGGDSVSNGGIDAFVLHLGS